MNTLCSLFYDYEKKLDKKLNIHVFLEKKMKAMQKQIIQVIDCTYWWWQAQSKGFANGTVPV